MENWNYNKTFTAMKAYSELGVQERSIIEFLFKRSVFNGNYSQLARAIKLDPANVRKILKYLHALGIVYIVYNKPEIEVIQTKSGKMKTCFLVVGWMETLIKRYQDGEIYQSDAKRFDYIKKMDEQLLKEMI